jgi:hypothetical protein
MTGATLYPELDHRRPTTSRLFWPANRAHRVVPTVLHSQDVPDVVEGLLGELHDLAALADTIACLEGRNGQATLSSAAGAARAEAAALLTSIAERLPGPESEVAAMRAAGITGGDQEAAARRQAEIDERDLVLLCGPTSTWRRKSSRTYFGAMASVPRAPENALIDRADALIDSVVEFMAETLSRPEITYRPMPGFRVADLLCCGGEPDGFPKHFAYFLPEDEGISMATPAKTVVYGNVYTTHHELISRALAERVLDPSAAFWPEDPLGALLLWFRGHDVGHQLRLPQTAWRELHAVGRETSIGLQEALADVIGYLAVTGGPWQSEFEIDRTVAGSLFLTEMLRYIQRGRGLFPDSDAAFLELGYLADHGYVEVDDSSGQIAWEPDSLHAGVSALARELTGALLDTDVARTQALLAAHLPDDDSWELAEWWARFNELTADVPTTLAYCRSREEMAS